MRHERERTETKGDEAKNEGLRTEVFIECFLETLYSSPALSTASSVAAASAGQCAS